MNSSVLRDVHEFWFGPLASPSDFPKDKSEIWFRQSDATDDLIRERFGRLISEAASADWSLDRLSRVEQVGLVVLLDQFPRNIHRSSGEAFAHDPAARAIAGELMVGGKDRFYFAERAFLILPFTHSEDVADQDYGVHLSSGLALEVPPDQKETYRVWLDFATKHRDVIRKFGRFPHRNAMLGRESTPEEIEFLKRGRGY
jgi:uncharacterized protein (DUF924 family)